jgi:hypothetical protein
MPLVTGMRVRIALRYQPFAHVLMPSAWADCRLISTGSAPLAAAVCPRGRGVALVGCQSWVGGIHVAAPVSV